MSKIKKLNDHLFDQLERLSDESLTPEKLQLEIDRTNAITDISSQIVKVADVAIKAEELRQKFRSPHQIGGKGKLLEDYS